MNSQVMSQHTLDLCKPRTNLYLDKATRHKVSPLGMELLTSLAAGRERESYCSLRL